MYNIGVEAIPSPGQIILGAKYPPLCPLGLGSTLMLRTYNHSFENKIHFFVKMGKPFKTAGISLPICLKL